MNSVCQVAVLPCDAMEMIATSISARSSGWRDHDLKKDKSAPGPTKSASGEEVFIRLESHQPADANQECA